MQDFKEYTAKTAEEAIEAGLKDLNLTRETAEIRILEEGKKKLFGAVKARVAIAPLCDTCEKTGAEACADCKKNSSEEKEESAAEQKERRAKIHTDESGKTDGERAVEFLEGLFEIMKTKKS